jgi:toxin YoeB
MALYKLDFPLEVFDKILTLESKEQKKVRAILTDIARNGIESGYAHCEPLKGDRSGLYSKSVDKKNRVIFKINEDTAEIFSVESHYGDK